MASNQIIEGELATMPDTSPRSVSISPNQLRKQMVRDQEMRAVIEEYIKNNMVEGKDYGSIEVKKGTGIMSKPGLLKPGAEKFCGLFKIRATFRKDPDTQEMLGNTSGIIAYICELVDSRGQIVGEGRGTAKTDPVNGADFDINKQVKIAQKRAQVDAVLRAGGLSDFFTQDIEDMPRNGSSADAEAHPASEKQKTLIAKLFMERGAKTPRQLLASIQASGVKDPKAMTRDEASDLIKRIFDKHPTIEVVSPETYGDDIERKLAEDEAEEKQKEQEHLEDIVGRGPGDPDVHGYPGEDEVIDGELSDEEIAQNLADTEAMLLGNDEEGSENE